MEMKHADFSKRLEVSYVYDPVEHILQCDVVCGGLRDGFCAVYDEYLTIATIHEYINGFVKYLLSKEEQQQ